MAIKKEDVVKNKNKSISKINEYFDKCLLKDDKYIKKVNLLSYWLNDYINYIEQEEIFNPAQLKNYSRGDIIKVNLGFNVGNEEGGLHYCVVLDKKNAISHSTITVIPLTSLKPSTKLHKTSVFIGDEIYKSLDLKNNNLLKETKRQLTLSERQLGLLDRLPETTDEEKIIKNFKIEEITNKMSDNLLRLELIKKIDKELLQMKSGSVALINQITTISKQRIYNPKKDFDILSGITLSNEKMKLIDEKIKKLFIN